MQNKIESFVKILIWTSIGLFFLELNTGTANSHESHWLFLWAERAIAGIFTIEYFIRWSKNKKYPLTIFGGIDFLAILPFWIGFSVPPEWLGMIRSLRILRLLKYFRYSRGLQLVALGFYRASSQLKYLAFPVMVAIMFSTVAMYEAERIAQPEVFSKLFNAFWFTMVTVTTVGYGDISPVTTPGRIIAITTFVTVLSLFAGFIGVLGNHVSKVLDEEIDPTIDPIKMFREEKAKNLGQDVPIPIVAKIKKESS